MAGLLAQRDQENLTYEHQTVAAAKPLNGGSRALAPKTPGNRATKTPFKIPLRDENGLDPSLTGVKKGKVNDNLFTGAKKALGERNAFITPAAPRNRAPLGQKTTNAKAATFQTPVPLKANQGAGKSGQKSVSARKPKPKVSHTEPAKINVLAANDEEEPDIEYMPPRPKDLPDYPDDIDLNLDLSMFDNGGLQRDFGHYLFHHKGWDGRSKVERDEIRAKRADDRYEAENQALTEYMLDTEGIVCVHDPDCPTVECRDAPEIRRKAKDKYNKKLSEIDARFRSLPPIGNDCFTEPKAAKKQISITKGPAVDASKRAASSLSMPKSKPAQPTAAPPKQTAAAKLPLNLVSRPKKPTQPTNPSSMRHTAAVATSNTTLGYSKGRVASATLRKARAAASDGAPASKPVDLNSLSPEEFIKQHGEPVIGTDMWQRCRRRGLVKLPSDYDKETAEEQQEDFMIPNPDGRMAEEYWREEAERDFEIKLDF